MRNKCAQRLAIIPCFSCSNNIQGSSMWHSCKWAETFCIVWRLFNPMIPVSLWISKHLLCAAPFVPQYMFQFLLNSRAGESTTTTPSSDLVLKGVSWKLAPFCPNWIVTRELLFFGLTHLEIVTRAKKTRLCFWQIWCVMRDQKTRWAGQKHPKITWYVH